MCAVPSCAYCNRNTCSGLCELNCLNGLLRGRGYHACLTKRFHRSVISSMCLHVLNAQTTLQCRTCKTWHECAECHDEATGAAHPFDAGDPVLFTCKNCSVVFQVRSTIALELACKACDMATFTHCLLPLPLPASTNRRA